ncbi:hypothetical protein AVEN_131770-1 [Araneus ventricosus]|uniref:Uncharacterized protein n=1 Tax=Araneus ventricosus TaxID=182803 RepID=A0A4Y2EM67_ARAVE|nr:hypothetical protein AVEN_131770-1 [Araneus ventricosus]
MGQVVPKKLSYVNFAGMISETVCAEMLLWTCSNLVGEIAHKKLSYVNLAAMVSKRFARKCLRGQPMENEMPTFPSTFFAIWDGDAGVRSDW